MTFEAFIRRKVRRQVGKRPLLSKHQGWQPVARARLIKPGFFSNEALSDLHPFARLLFIGLWQLADRKGRLADRPKVIKGALFPFDNVPVDKYLGELAERAFILRYEVDEERYIQVVKFETHQHVHKNETDSVIPPPNGWDDSDTLVRNAPSIGETAPVISQTAPAEASSTPTPTPKAEARTEASSNRERLRAVLSFGDGEWRELIAKHPGVNVHARYWDFLDWIGEREEERMPDSPLNAFYGFLKNKNGPSNIPRGIREEREAYGAVSR